MSLLSGYGNQSQGGIHPPDSEVHLHVHIKRSVYQSNWTIHNVKINTTPKCWWLQPSDKSQFGSNWSSHTWDSLGPASASWPVATQRARAGHLRLLVAIPIKIIHRTQLENNSWRTPQSCLAFWADCDLCGLLQFERTTNKVGQFPRRRSLTGV